MSLNKILSKHQDLLDEVILHAQEIKSLLLKDEDYFGRNNNFLVRSIVINICSCIESYVKEVFEFVVVHHFGEQLKKMGMPLPIAYLLQEKGVSEKVLKSTKDKANFVLNNDKRTLDNITEYPSANFDKTLNVFAIMGIDLKDYIEEADVSQITQLVNKRNQIVHKNDRAGDISIADTIKFTQVTKNYLQLMHKALLSRYETIA
jgi:hypothetical protein